MTRHTALRSGLAAIGATLLLAGCGASAPGTAALGSNAAAAAAAAGGQTSQPAGDPGKSLDNFDPCSVVSDSDLVAAITASAGDPSALGTLTATHAPVDGAATGLPGAKACKQTWTTTDSNGTVSQGGDPVIVTFDKYINLTELKGTNPIAFNDYAASGAEAFEGPGDAGVPHITKDGYLFRMSGNSDTKLLKAIALGIAKRI